MVKSMLPPGFRFHPTDVELVMYYLKRKVMGKKLMFEAITELNIYKFSPWDLPDKSRLKMKDLEWFFFCPRERKYAAGFRMNRATETGYWKTTGRDRPVDYNGKVVGKIRTLVFHLGSAPNGKRTDWVIHEYRLEDESLADKGVPQDTFVLCKVFHKNGPGPKNGAQYGAPFLEEEWDNDSENPDDSLSPDGPFPFEVDLQKNQNSPSALRIVEMQHSSGLSLSEPGPSVVRPSQDEVLLNEQNNSMLTGSVDPANTCGWSLSQAGVSLANLSAQGIVRDAENDDIAHLLASFKEDDALLPIADAINEDEVLLNGQNNSMLTGVVDPANTCGCSFSQAGISLANLSAQGIARDAEIHDIAHLLASFKKDDALLPVADVVNEVAYLDEGREIQPVPNFYGSDRFSGLEDLNVVNGGGHHFSDMGFLELDDLNAPLNFSTKSCKFGEMQTNGLLRPFIPSGSQHILPQSLCKQYNSNSVPRQVQRLGNFPWDSSLINSIQQPSLPDSSHNYGNAATTVAPMGNIYTLLGRHMA